MLSISCRSPRKSRRQAFFISPSLCWQLYFLDPGDHPSRGCPIFATAWTVAARHAQRRDEIFDMARVLPVRPSASCSQGVVSCFQVAVGAGAAKLFPIKVGCTAMRHLPAAAMPSAPATCNALPHMRPQNLRQRAPLQPETKQPRTPSSPPATARACVHGHASPAHGQLSV